MNLVVTNRCNRRCEYCFQKEWFLANSHKDIMDIDLKTVETFLKWSNVSFFNLLGGEPLLHPEIEALLDLLHKHDKKVMLISNISVCPNKFKNIVSRYTGDVIIGWMVNTDYPVHQKDTFLKNLEFLLNDVSTDCITLSTTLLPNSKSIKLASNRLKEILKSCDNTDKLAIRISPASPYGQMEHSSFDYTKDVYDFYKEIQSSFERVSINFDCPTNGCEVDYDFLWQNTFINYISTHSCYDSVPLDIMPDKSVIWCSSANFIKIDNFEEFTGPDEVKKELQRQYLEYWKTHTLLCNYKTCGKYGTCKGLCVAKNEAKNKGV